jgi:UDP-N-acetylglucosamine--N-acetylmuramyl-(pentapeptide) pyrophosphoryl-undecaprenol N-acetylglucosamine transferase
VSKFLISCGGTGGHLAPGIALAEELRDRGHEVRLLISQKRVDARLIEKYPELNFVCLPGTGFSWRPIQLLRCGLGQLLALWSTWRLVKRMRPDTVVGFGGFTSAPLVIAAWLSGVPCALHESNRVPGLAVRKLGRWAQRVYLPSGISIEKISALKTRHVGMPLRREMTRQSRELASAALGFEPAHRLLVILGGSQGASVLNEWAREHLTALAAEGIQVLVVTGLGKGAESQVELRTKAGAPLRAIFTPFTDQMAVVLSAADLVVSRAGAGTLAELVRCGTPAILVPYPLAADDHQRANADFFERQGGGFIRAQTDRAGLLDQVLTVMGNERCRQKLRANLNRINNMNTIDLLVADLEAMAQSRAGLRKQCSAS